MVVVVIIGILVAIAIPIYSTVTENAEGRACQANQRVIDGAIAMWYAESTANSGAPTMAQLADYIADPPTCPEDGDPYVPAVLDAGNLTPSPNTLAGHAR